MISEPGDELRHVYFPLDCLISLLAAVDDQGDLEVGLVGKESLAGMTLALGHQALRRGARAHAATAALIDRCVFVAMGTAMQIAACNRSHVLEARLARWCS